MRILFFALTLFSLLNPIHAIATDTGNTPTKNPKQTDAKIYKYTGKDGVSVFTNNIDSIPLSLRNKMEVLEVKQKAKITQPKSNSQSLVHEGIRNPFIRNILIVIAVIILFWIIKLWIKNMILKFIARIAIKAALIGLLYMLAHHWFFSSDKGSFFEIARKTAAPYRDILPIQKATEGIKDFTKKEEQKKKELDSLP